MRSGCVFIVLSFLVRSVWAHEIAGPLFTYKNEQGSEIVYVQIKGGALKGPHALVRFSGFRSEWDGKVLLHKIQEGTNKKLIFEKPTGNKFSPVSQFVSLIDSNRKTLRNGSLVSEVLVFVQGGERDGYKLIETASTAKSEDLLKAFKPSEGKK